MVGLCLVYITSRLNFSHVGSLVNTQTQTTSQTTTSTASTTSASQTSSSYTSTTLTPTLTTSVTWTTTFTTSSTTPAPIPSYIPARFIRLLYHHPDNSTSVLVCGLSNGCSLVAVNSSTESVGTIWTARCPDFGGFTDGLLLDSAELGQPKELGARNCLVYGRTAEGSSGFNLYLAQCPTAPPATTAGWTIPGPGERGTLSSPFTTYSGPYAPLEACLIADSQTAPENLVVRLCSLAGTRRWEAKDVGTARWQAVGFGRPVIAIED